MTEEQTQLAARAVLNWVNREHANALAESAELRAGEVGRHAARRAWNSEHPEDGVGCWSENPFDDSSGRKAEAARHANERSIEWASVQQFVVECLCTMVKP